MNGIKKKAAESESKLELESIGADRLAGVGIGA